MIQIDTKQIKIDLNDGQPGFLLKLGWLYHR
jgi:hypothetical protein